MFILFRTVFQLKFVWLPLILAGVFFTAFIHHDSGGADKVKRMRTMDMSVYKILSKQWIEGTYRSVGLGAAEGLHSKAVFFSSPKPLNIRNPITDIALRNNLSIACLQMDVIWNYLDNTDAFLVEGNITFKGVHPFNQHLNNSVLYTKSLYIRELGGYWLMSTTIDSTKPTDEFKKCSNVTATATRNIRFDSYIEQMNALTFPSGYLAFTPIEEEKVLFQGEASYVTNAEYLQNMFTNKPVMVKTNKKALGNAAYFASFLSIPGILTAKSTMARQERAIAENKKDTLNATRVYSNSVNVRAKYLARMSDILQCGKSNEYNSICDLGGGIIYKKTQ